MKDLWRNWCGLCTCDYRRIAFAHYFVKLNRNLSFDCVMGDILQLISFTFKSHFLMRDIVVIKICILRQREFMLFLTDNKLTFLNLKYFIVEIFRYWLFCSFAQCLSLLRGLILRKIYNFYFLNFYWWTFIVLRFVSLYQMICFVYLAQLYNVLVETLFLILNYDVSDR